MKRQRRTKLGTLVAAWLPVLMLLAPGSASGAMGWEQKAPANSPSDVRGSAMAWDGARGEVVLFGGIGCSTCPSHTWVWDGNTWAEKAVISPDIPSGASMVSDAARREVVLFGGLDSFNLADVNANTWVWDGNTWTQKFPATKPPGRSEFGMAFDATRGQVVAFGGNPGLGGTNGPLADTWIWDGNNWTQKSPAMSPSARSNFSMAYDAAHSQVVLFGGYDKSHGATLSDTWIWDGNNWSQKFPALSPSARRNFGMTWDAERREVVLFGGEFGGQVFSDTWVWDGNNWTQKSPATSPPARDSFGMAYDELRRQVVIFGGSGESRLLDTWVWWNQPTVPVTITSAQTSATFSVSGANCQGGSGYTVPKTLDWLPGSSCTVTFASPVSAGAGIRGVFTGWFDAITTNPRTITVPSGPTTYTANYKTQYQLSTRVSPSGAGTVSGEGFYDANTTASVVASANSGYQFAGWTPVLSPDTASSTVSMTAPQSVTANFVLLTTVTVPAASGQYSDPVTLSAMVSPADAVFSGLIQFQIDGTNAGPPVPVTGGGTYSTSYAISGAAGARTITATLTSMSPVARGSSGTGTLTVRPEDATLQAAPTNPQPEGSLISLTGSLQPAPDGSPGDVSLATVTATLVPSSGSNISCAVASTAGALTATCSNPPAATYTVQWRVTGGYYAAPPVDTTLTVYDPSITITSNLPGRTFSVAGENCQAGNYTTPKVLQWTSGASCTVSFTPTQAGAAGTQYVFTNWADGAAAASRTITAPGAATTYTANFKTQFQLTPSASPAGSGSVTGAGYHDAGSTAAVAATPVAGYQLLAWTGPVASASSASTTVTMNAPVTVTANFQLLTATTVSSVSGQHSDAVTLSAVVGPAGGVFSGSIQFQVDGVSAGPAIPVSGAGTYTSNYIVRLAAGPHTITATLMSASLAAAGSSGAGTLTVTREDATITPASGNPTTVQVSSPGGTANTITLTGQLQEPSDGSPGDLSKAVVTVSLLPAVSGSPTIACAVSNAAASLTATCSSVPVNAYTVQWNISGDYYQAPPANTVLAVYDPSLGFVTGSGSVVINGVSAEFSVSVQYKKDGAIGGGMSWVEHRSTGDITISSTVLTSMAIVGTTAVIDGQARVNGSGTYPLRVNVTDNGSPGANRDLFGLQASPAVSFNPVAITSGNIQVH